MSNLLRDEIFCDKLIDFSSIPLALDPHFLTPFSEFSFETTLDPDVMSELTGSRAFGGLTFEPTIMFEQTRQVQKRRHKKKRINKKWAKRYGYFTVVDKFRITEVSLVSSNDGDDTIDFIGKTIGRM